MISMCAFAFIIIMILHCSNASTMQPRVPLAFSLIVLVCGKDLLFAALAQHQLTRRVCNSLLRCRCHGGSTTTLKKFERSLDDTSNPVSLIRTLRQLASSTEESEVQPILNASESASSVQYLLYNDQPDGTAPSSSYGHTKGVLAMQGSDAIW